MNKKYKLIVYIITAYILFFTEFIPNVASLIASNSYFIPKESSIFNFSVTLENLMNGEYWIYGEDEKYCYYSGVVSYTSIKKKNICLGFDKLDYRTWCGIDIHNHDGYPDEKAHQF